MYEPALSVCLVYSPVSGSVKRDTAQITPRCMVRGQSQWAWRTGLQGAWLLALWFPLLQAQCFLWSRDVSHLIRIYRRVNSWPCHLTSSHLISSWLTEGPFVWVLFQSFALPQGFTAGPRWSFFMAPLQYRLPSHCVKRTQNRSHGFKFEVSFVLTFLH